MKKIMGTLILILFTSLLQAPPNNASVIFASEGMNPFENLFKAVCQVESSGNPFAYNATDQKGGSWGIVQIGESMLNAFNAENRTNFVLNDCFDVSVSRSIFMWHFQKQHPDIEAASRSWNGGRDWKRKKSTARYFAKVKYYL